MQMPILGKCNPLWSHQDAKGTSLTSHVQDKQQQLFPSLLNAENYKFLHPFFFLVLNIMGEWDDC